MGSFFGVTCDMQYARDFENHLQQSKVSWYISTNIDDIKWQELISSQLQKFDCHHDCVSIILRLFRRETIKEKKYKSITRYYKADEYLNIDIMLDIDNYLDLPEEEVRRLMCDDIFSYVEEMLIKYQKRFHNFDAIAFIPLLKDRIEEIKGGLFEDDFYQTQSYQNIILAEELMNKVKSDGL